MISSLGRIVEHACRALGSLCILFLLPLSLSAQQNYFVDGFHGGVYGHYPLDWYTQFLVDNLESHPDWYIGMEIEPETWDSVRVHTPEAYQQFCRYVGGPQVEFTNPSYAQSYLYCINGESIIRQFQYGIRKLRTHFPDARIETYACEEPCFTSCLPSILPMFGFRYLSLKCPDTCWGGYAANFGGEIVDLIGPDGTSMPCSPRYECEDLQEGSVWQTIAWSNNAQYWRRCHNAGIANPVGMCYQDAGWKNGQWIGYDSIRFDTKYTLWSDYFQKVLPIATPTPHRFSIEDVRPGLMWGSQVLQRLSQQCRRAEFELLCTEKLLAMAKILRGYEWDQTLLDEAWRMLMLSQHHDCWIVPYNGLNKRGTWADNVALWTQEAIAIAHELNNEALETLRSEDKQSKAFTIFNTTGSRIEDVTVAYDEKGTPYFINKEIPAYGYITIPLSKVAKPKSARDIRITHDECTVSTAFYDIRFDLKHGGRISSLKDKRTGYEYADSHSAYGIAELRGYYADEKTFLSTADEKATVTIDCDNQLCKWFTINTRIGDTCVAYHYKLNNTSPVIDCSLEVDWKRNHHIGKMYDTHYNLNLLFPVAFRDGKIFKAAPFDVCESVQNDNTYSEWTDIKHNIFCEWIDLMSASADHGLALFCDHTNSYTHAPDMPFAMTVQYSGKGLWGRDYRITQPTKMHFAIVPHSKRWDEAGIFTLSNQWNEPVLVVQDNADKVESKSLLDLTGTGRELTSVTLQDAELVVRTFNASTESERFSVKSERIRNKKTTI